MFKNQIRLLRNASVIIEIHGPLVFCIDINDCKLRICLNEQNHYTYCYYKSISEKQFSEICIIKFDYKM